jgi:hypothetical protein
MKQIVIVMETRQGLIADISEILGNRGINIETLDAEEQHGLDIVTLTVDRYDEALQALRDASIEAVTEDAVLLRVKDEPGSLAKIARRFKEADIHMRSLRIVRRQPEHAIVAVSMDRTEEAVALVKDLLIAE